MNGYKLKIGSSEIEINKDIFNYLKDDTLMPKIEATNADYENKKITLNIGYYVEPLRLIEFLKSFVSSNRRFFNRKKRITKNRFKNIRTLIKFN